MEKNNIIQFDKIVTVIEREETDQPEPTMNIVEEKWKYCPHDRVNIFIHHRQMMCKDCQKALDPFDFVRKLANEESNHIIQISYLRHTHKSLEKDKAELERQIQNLKAQRRKYQ